MKPLIAYITILVILISSSCSDDYLDDHGPIVTQELTLNSFENVNFQVPGEITIKHGATQMVMVTGQAGIIHRLNTDVKEDTWNINLGKGRYRNSRLDIVIVLPDVSQVILSGSGSISIDGFDEQSNDMLFEISGSGDIHIGRIGIPGSIETEVSGSGSIHFNEILAEVNDLDINISGSGNFYGYSAPAKTCDIVISGSGNCEINVSDVLSADIHGSGVVFYKGQPSMQVIISGSGSVRDAN